MTLDELAEKYGLSRNSVIYRRKHGIPLDRPKSPGNRTFGDNRKGSKNVVGVIPTRVCPMCKHIYPIRSKACPHCGVLAPRKGE